MPESDNIVKRLAPKLMTWALVAAAVGSASLLYNRWTSRPWTRDGQVRATIIKIAPQVSGYLVEVPIVVASPQDTHGGTHQLAMIALHVKTAGHGAGVGKGGWIQQDEVILAVCLAQPLQAIGPHHAVSSFIKAVVSQVLAQPCKVRVGQVDTGRAAGSAQGGMHRGTAGVAE